MDRREHQRRVLRMDDGIDHGGQLGIVHGPQAGPRRAAIGGHVQLAARTAEEASRGARQFPQDEEIGPTGDPVTPRSRSAADPDPS